MYVRARGEALNPWVRNLALGNKLRKGKEWEIFSKGKGEKGEVD